MLHSNILQVLTPYERGTKVCCSFPLSNDSKSSMHAVITPHSPLQETVHSSSASRMYFPSLYFSRSSNALSYFQPTVSLHWRHEISRTSWRPVVMLRSTASACEMLTTESNKYALPCWPRKFWPTGIRNSQQGSFIRI